MAILSSFVFSSLLSLLKKSGYPAGSTENKDMIFKAINKTDIVPIDCINSAYRVFALYYYNPENVGYNGILNEIKKRITTQKTTEKVKTQGGILVRDFMLHHANETDTIHFDTHTPIEEKSGCGDWLRSYNAVTFEELIKEYRRKRTKIRWDYSFTVESKKNGNEKYHIKITTSYSTLFDFLAEYNGKLETWFTESSRSGLSGLTLYKMQEIKTSRKKAQYLLTFAEWKKGRD